MSRARLEEHRDVWATKPALRAVYQYYFRRIADLCEPGITVEIGSGPGLLRESIPGVFSTDVIRTPWIDVVADAQELPFADASISNLILFDVLHHVPEPSRFFREAERVLRPDGKVILLEPAITPVSYAFYKFIHEEPVDTRVNPFDGVIVGDPTDPFDSNQAIPTLLFVRHHREFQRRFPALRMERSVHLALFAYPMSGGFQRWSLVSVAWAERLLWLEEKAEKLLGPLLGFRLLTVLTRTSDER